MAPTVRVARYWSCIVVDHVGLNTKQAVRGHCLREYSQFAVTKIYTYFEPHYTFSVDRGHYNRCHVKKRPAGRAYDGLPHPSLLHSFLVLSATFISVYGADDNVSA